MASSKRPVRAFGDVPRTDRAALQRTGDKGSESSRQFSNTGEDMPEGGNSAGRTVSGVNAYMVPDFQGRSGQPDNQSVNRPKGST